jgi:hypothetical protein
MLHDIGADKFSYCGGTQTTEWVRALALLPSHHSTIERSQRIVA